MKTPAPHAQQVRVREIATGQVFLAWPVDAREMVNQPDGGYDYAPEQPEEIAREPQPESDSGSFLESRVKSRATLEAKSYKELQELAKKVGVSANMKGGELIDALLPHVEGGGLSLEEVPHFTVPNVQFPNARASE